MQGTINVVPHFSTSATFQSCARGEPTVPKPQVCSHFYGHTMQAASSSFRSPPHLIQCPRSTPNATVDHRCNVPRNAATVAHCPPTVVGSNAATNQPRAPAVSRGLSRVARHAQAWLGRRAWPLVAASQPRDASSQSPALNAQAQVLSNAVHVHANSACARRKEAACSRARRLREAQMACCGSASDASEAGAAIHPRDDVSQKQAWHASTSGHACIS